MKTEELALVQGWADTRSTLARWNRKPWTVLWAWTRGSLAVQVNNRNHVGVVIQDGVEGINPERAIFGPDLCQ